MRMTQTFPNGTTLYWTDGSDGGGTTQYADFTDILSNSTKVYNRGLEWCAGLGAIGFSIMDIKKCNTFAFMDLYSIALDDVKFTSEANNITDRVTTYQCDEVNKIPKHEKFDLIVANPPHCFNPFPGDNIDHAIRLVVDQDWKIHKEFFNNITSYLLPDADIFLSETGIYQEHIQLAKQNGLKFKGTLPAPALCKDAGDTSIIMHYKYET